MGHLYKLMYVTSYDLTCGGRLDELYSDIVCTLCELSINAHPSLYSCSCTL